MADILDCLARQNFKRVISLSGHVSNSRGVELGFEKSLGKTSRFKTCLLGLLELCRFKRSWYAVRSRFEFNSESCGVQGETSKANPNDSEADY